MPVSSSTNANDDFESIQRVESMLLCNVGDAIVVPCANVICGLRSAVAGAEDLFAVVVRDSLVHCTWSHFEELPLLAKELVVTFLDVDTALALGCASRACQALVNSNSVWHDIAVLKFGEEACQPMLSQQGTSWRERFKQMFVARQHLARANLSARPNARHFSLSPNDVMREWMETEQKFLEHMVIADRRAHELVRRGYVWFDCLQQLFPIHERFAADMKRIFVEHAQRKRLFAVREAPPALMESLVCHSIARAVAMYRDPTWCANIPEAVLVPQRTNRMSTKIYDFPVEGAAEHEVPGLSFIVLISRIARYSLLLRELRRRSQAPFVREMIALAEQSLQFTKKTHHLTELEEKCHALAPKRPLSDFLALTKAEARSWVILSRPAHLMLMPGALLVIDADTNRGDNDGATDVVLSLRGATLHFAGGELSVTSAAGKTHKFRGVASEFVAEMQKQLATEAAPAAAPLSDDNDHDDNVEKKK